jgi:hypothetical protein
MDSNLKKKIYFRTKKRLAVDKQPDSTFIDYDATRRDDATATTPKLSAAAARPSSQAIT